MTALLDTSRRAIRERADAGWPLERIEAEVIATARLDPEARAALWLWGWHCCQRESAADAERVRLPDAA